ncbi:LOW QUALITY PROTEIN: BON1-associated protein 2 [Aegilops tauschii subsp. strangulata]|uniref:LOW QUALITY PROTEIN: BON1-associated protein 2 n=1 Tax=Aegilops tauschii subsp. strangulata TaxID=200361 RepID=UPI001ABD31D1|nr:LOW QUALITY PROTEIN: BON1-associated protein 2-like [Aegilops tauschii subsp. strangulata]
MALKGPSSFAKQPRKSWRAKLMTLEVTVLSGEGLHGVALAPPLHRDAFAAVNTDSSAARTGFNDEDGDCNGYPYWGEAVRVTVPEQSRTIDVEIYGQRGDGRQEFVAAALVPVADFRAGPPGHLHCLSYRLFDTGFMLKTRNGIVNITVKRLDGAQASATAGEGKGAKAAEDAAKWH